MTIWLAPVHVWPIGPLSHPQRKWHEHHRSSKSSRIQRLYTGHRSPWLLPLNYITIAMSDQRTDNIVHPWPSPFWHVVLKVAVCNKLGFKVMCLEMAPNFGSIISWNSTSMSRYPSFFSIDIDPSSMVATQIHEGNWAPIFVNLLSSNGLCLPDQLL